MSLDTKRRPHDKHPTNVQPSEVVEDAVEENAEVLIERPPGKTTEKENLKWKSRDSCDAEFNMVLVGMTDDRRLCMAERRAWVMRVDHDRDAQLKLEKKKFKEEIMSKDLASMNVIQQDYFPNILRKIYEASLNISECTFDKSPSTPHGGV